MASNSNIVVEWLRSLHLGQYAESFLDNGYDDLEICKQVGDPDLDAIGVFNQAHRGRLLGSVRALREEGAASVYFSLEETAAAALNMAFNDDLETGSGVSSRNSSTTGRPASESDREGNAGCGRPGPGSGSGSASGAHSRAAHTGPQGHSPAPSSAGSNHELGKYLDEYEEGKAELVRLPRSLLRKLLREKLVQDGIRLCHQPYSTSDGERGYLDGLASRYADLYRTHYADVLEHLEQLRRREWADMSPRIRVLGMESPTTPTSQPIYVPGKYSPSSCLSDREEDEIYGLTGAGRPPAAPPSTYQACLSPRAAYFYELPPNEAARGKKRTALSRLLRGLKSKGRTARRGPGGHAGHATLGHHGTLGPHHQGHATLGHHHQGHPGLTLQHCSPRQHRAHQIYARVTTPDGDAALVPQFLDLREYDRLLHLNGGGVGGVGGGGAAGAGAAGPRGPQADFEETIHRLKLQDAIRQKERYHREHEEILRDIRQGLLRLDPQTRLDDTYMYDTELMAATAGAPGAGPSGGHQAGHQGGGQLGAGPPPQGGLQGHQGHQAGPLHLGHWYDEPPYESDPEDFLMGVIPGTAAGGVIPNGRTCLTLNLRPTALDEAVISLRSAGDISLGGTAAPAAGHVPGMRLVSLQRRGRGRGRARGQAQGLQGRDRSRGRPGPGPAQHDQRGSCSDVHNMSSHLSAMSIGYHWDQQQLAAIKKHQYRCRSSQSEGTLSPCRSPDLVETQTESQPRSISLVGRMKGLRQDVQRKISRLRGLTGSSNNSSNPSCYRGCDQSEQAIPMEHLPAASSMESLPSGSGSSTQALVRDGSNESSLSPIASHDVYHTIGRARALVDYNPSPYDRDALKFKKGDILEILAMSPSGMWRGRLNGNIGFFKFINVEVIPGSVMLTQQSSRGHLKGRPHSVEELLRRVNLEECTSVFILNGYEDIESFKDLREEDLDYLGIKSTETRAKIRAAIRLLHDYDCTATDNSNGESDSGGEDDDDDDVDDGEEEYDSSSGSDLGLGRAPQPLPLSGKFPPGLLDQHGAGASRAPRVCARAVPKGRRSSPPAPAPAAASYHPNIPVPGAGATSASIDSYVVARKGGKCVTVEAAPRTPGPPVLPRTGSTSSSSSSARRARPLPSPGATPPAPLEGSPTAAAAAQDAADQRFAAKGPPVDGDGPAGVLKDGDGSDSCDGAHAGSLPADQQAHGLHPSALNGLHPGAEQAAPSSVSGVVGVHITNASVSERSSDSGVSSSSSQPSSRESDGRRGCSRSAPVRHPQTNC
ncbi:uncharacterized protein LOC113202267 isoform X3 [Frankliniella occidentalis]|uniref:Sterile alpha motif domain-containing protein 5 n=1 Tax=Frankliniella occidentalis TaxID=133901 RepID=A0A9C6X7G3_FRAOC|nr:uncharacterized protein LOC113202267 isoform X3 [Frankliniella occidentalis]